MCSRSAAATRFVLYHNIFKLVSGDELTRERQISHRADMVSYNGLGVADCASSVASYCAYC